MKNFFLIDPEITFLNHGSFGACPRPVFEEYQKWQLKIEKQPVEFFYKSMELLKESRQKLAEFLGTISDNILYITNSTFGLNVICNSLVFNPDDELLTTDLEYGAVLRMLKILEKSNKFAVRIADTQFPILSKDHFTNNFISNINSRTKAILISQITSATALRLPVEEICKAAKEKGIITIIDGSHVPGQLDIELDNNDFDFFVGNCHKWMMTPKGSALLYAKPSMQKMLKPLVISWGDEAFKAETDFITEFQFQGTRDISAFLAVPSAIEFMKENNWCEVSNKCRFLIKYAKQELTKTLKTKTITTDDSLHLQMYSHPLPINIDLINLKQELYKKYKIEIPVTKYKDMWLIRISIQAYNTKEDIDNLISALSEII